MRRNLTIKILFLDDGLRERRVLIAERKVDTSWGWDEIIHAAPYKFALTYKLEIVVVRPTFLL